MVKSCKNNKKLLKFSYVPPVVLPNKPRDMANELETNIMKEDLETMGQLSTETTKLPDLQHPGWSRLILDLI